MMDGRTLPRYASGVYSTATWGMLGLIVIEGLVVAALIVSWFYLRFHNPRWPPDGIDAPALWMPALRTALLGISAALSVHAARSAFRLEPSRLGRWSLGSTAILVLYLVWQTMDLLGTDHHWTQHAYSSMYWTLQVYAGLHALALLGLQLGIGGFIYADRLGERGPVALQICAMYSVFVAISSALTWLTLHAAPHVL